MPVPSSLRPSACPQPWGHSLVLPLTASTSFDVGDGVNYYPGKAEAKVTSSWSCCSSGPPGTALGQSSLSPPPSRKVQCSSCPGAAHGTCASHGARTLPSVSPVAHLATGTPGQGLSHGAVRTGAGTDTKGFVSWSCIYAVKLCLFLAQQPKCGSC